MRFSLSSIRFGRGETTVLLEGSGSRLRFHTNSKSAGVGFEKDGEVLADQVIKPMNIYELYISSFLMTRGISLAVENPFILSC